jgi:hypothetical protein
VALPPREYPTEVMVNDNKPGDAESTGAASFDFLFSHDDTVHRSTAEPSDEHGRAHRKSDDEAGPGRPLEMRFSGDGEPADRRAAS